MLFLLITAAIAVAFVGGRAWADGIPGGTEATLYYSGYVEDDTGPLDGPTAFRVLLWTAMTGGVASVCSTGPTALMINVDDGHFRLPLPPECVEAVHANPNLWVEVIVAGETLPRQHLGAVPYAVEAETAGMSRVSATLAPIVAGSEQISVDGIYVGVSAPSTGNAGGYAGAKNLCETPWGATAHVCSGEELGRSLQLGATLPAGRILGGTYAFYPPSTDINECDGFTGTSAGRASLGWSGTSVGFLSCSTMHPFLCCD